MTDIEWIVHKGLWGWCPPRAEGFKTGILPRIYSPRKMSVTQQTQKLWVSWHPKWASKLSEVFQLKKFPVFEVGPLPKFSSRSFIDVLFHYILSLQTPYYVVIYWLHMDSPDGSVIKKSACQCRWCKFDPWVRKIPWRRNGPPTPVFLPEKSQRSVVVYSPWGHKRVGYDLVTKNNNNNMYTQLSKKTWECICTLLSLTAFHNSCHGAIFIWK